LRGFAPFQKYQPVHSRLPVVHEKSGSFLTRAGGVTANKRMIRSFIVSSGDITIHDGEGFRTSLSYTLLFACGSVTLDVSGPIESLVIVCDGDVTFRDPPGTTAIDCLIVAGGDVTLPREALDSAIFAGGSVKQPRKIARARCVVRENERNPLGRVRFFDPAEAGVEVAPDKDGVKVKEAPRDRPFASAGLRPGDVVTALDGARTDSPEVFRKLLRAALAGEGPSLTLTVQRSGKTLTVAVPVKD
jgi:hypothetical protein